MGAGRIYFKLLVSGESWLWHFEAIITLTSLLGNERRAATPGLTHISFKKSHCLLHDFEIPFVKN
jgi:hypothetical protein